MQVYKTINSTTNRRPPPAGYFQSGDEHDEAAEYYSDAEDAKNAKK